MTNLWFGDKVSKIRDLKIKVGAPEQLPYYTRPMSRRFYGPEIIFRHILAHLPAIRIFTMSMNARMNAFNIQTSGQNLSCLCKSAWKMLASGYEPLICTNNFQMIAFSDK